jgi:hypothetical protein
MTFKPFGKTVSKTWSRRAASEAGSTRAVESVNSNTASHPDFVKRFKGSSLRPGKEECAIS